MALLRLTSSWTIRTAMALATSPAAWPPMPSATMNRPSRLSMRKLSSLWFRTRPTSVAAKNRMLSSRGIAHRTPARNTSGSTTTVA